MNRPTACGWQDGAGEESSEVLKSSRQASTQSVSAFRMKVVRPMQRIFRLLMVVVVVIAGASWYLHWSKTRAMNSGEVHVREQPGNAAKTAAPEAASANQPAPPEDQAANGADASGSQNSAQPQGAQSSVYTLPASDTISRNPPDRTILAGAGRYELYRQGDITWRMDTATGQACVLFATEAMWRRSLVYAHGCGAS